MKKFLFHIITTTTLLGSLAACSQDDGTAVSDRDLMGAISFNVNIGSLPTPEVTMRGHSTSQDKAGYTFSGGEYVAVAVKGMGVTSRNTAETIKQYSVAAGTGSCVLTYQKEADGTTTGYGFDWLSTTEEIGLRAWSNGKTTTPETPVTDPVGQEFTIETTQSGDIKELLYSKSHVYSFGTVDIPLYHQLSRIVVNVKDDKNGTIDAITIGEDSDGNRVPLTGQFAAPTTTEYGSWAMETYATTPGHYGVVTPKKETTPTAGYNYSYTAVVIPSQTGSKVEYPANMKLINITIGSRKFSYKIPSGGIEMKPGYQYNFNITVKNAYLEVTGDISPWGDGQESNTAISATL